MDRERAVTKAEAVLEALHFQMKAPRSGELGSRGTQVVAREEELRMREGEAQGRLYVLCPSTMLQLLTKPS